MVFDKPLAEVLEKKTASPVLDHVHALQGHEDVFDLYLRVVTDFAHRDVVGGLFERRMSPESVEDCVLPVAFVANSAHVRERSFRSAGKLIDYATQEVT